MATLSSPEKVHEILRFYREQKRLSLQGVHQETRISIPYLEAMEQGRWDAFPAEVYRLGFLRRYAAYLGLDPEEVLKVYREEMRIQDTHHQEEERKVVELRKLETSDRMTQGLLFAALVLLLSVGWFYTVMRSRSPEPRRLPSLPMRKRLGVPLTGEETAAPLVLNVSARAQVWIRVLTDGKLQFEGFLNAGTLRSWEAGSQIALRIGDVRSVDLTLNGHPVNAAAGAQKDVNDLKLDHETLRQLEQASAPSEAPAKEIRALLRPAAEKPLQPQPPPHPSPAPEAPPGHEPAE